MQRLGMGQQLVGEIVKNCTNEFWTTATYGVLKDMARDQYLEWGLWTTKNSTQ